MSSSSGGDAGSSDRNATERLRIKHIRTLEMLQKVVDENARLQKLLEKAGGGGGEKHTFMWGFPHHRPVAARYPTRRVGYLYSASSPGGLGRYRTDTCPFHY